MISFMDVLQSLASNMRVDLCRCYICMTEHDLNRAEIRPSFQQMGCKRMPESVGMDFLVETRPKCIPSHDFPETLARQPFTRSIKKKDVSSLVLYELRPSV